MPGRLASNAFDIHSGVKKGCILVPILFGIFLHASLKKKKKKALRFLTEGNYLQTRSFGKLSKLAKLEANTKVTRPYPDLVVFK